MNFTHKKLVVLKFKESVQISRQSRFLNYGCDFFWTFDTLHALSVRMYIQTFFFIHRAGTCTVQPCNMGSN